MKTKLFCMPYAGGSANFYADWHKYFDENIEIIPVELRGRGKKARSEFYNSISDAAEDVFKELKLLNDGSKIALFGHSLGSLIAYEVYIRMIKQSIEPVHIFFSGRCAPHIKNFKICHDLPDEEFIQEILKYGGTPNEILKDNALRSYFLPILRSDFKISETYTVPKEIQGINCGISIINGTNDTFVTNKGIAEWGKYALKEIDYYYVEGGHFYINSDKIKVLSIINGALNDI